MKNSALQFGTGEDAPRYTGDGRDQDDLAAVQVIADLRGEPFEVLWFREGGEDGIPQVRSPRRRVAPATFQAGDTVVDLPRELVVEDIARAVQERGARIASGIRFATARDAGREQAQDWLDRVLAPVDYLRKLCGRNARAAAVIAGLALGAGAVLAASNFLGSADAAETEDPQEIVFGE